MVEWEDGTRSPTLDWVTPIVVLNVISDPVDKSAFVMLGQVSEEQSNQDFPYFHSPDERHHCYHGHILVYCNSVTYID